MSENISELAKALNKFKSQHPVVPLDEEVQVKDRAGKFLYSFKFASLPAIKRDIEPFLTNNELTISQIPDEGNKLITILMHNSGQFLSGCMELDELNTLDKDGIRQNSGPQDFGKLLSFARRYAYCAIVGLIGDATSDKNEPADIAKRKNISTGSASTETQKQSDSKPLLEWLNHKNLKGEVTNEWYKAVKYMTEENGNIDHLLTKYRINQANKNELLIAKELYVSIDMLDHMTEDVKKKINDSRSLPELQGIWDMYKNLQSNKDFIDFVSMKKNTLVFPAKSTPQPTF